MKNNLSSAEEKAMNKYAELVIARVEALSEGENWQKPWFGGSVTNWPTNVEGRGYSGGNAFFLSLLCAAKGYEVPAFITFNKMQEMNEKKDAPRVMIKKGESSFPVLFTSFTAVNPGTGEKMTFEKYDALSEAEKANFMIFPKTHVYNVFNVAQTNLEETRPEVVAKLKGDFVPNKVEVMPKLEKMLQEQSWFCPVIEKLGESAYYSVSKDEVIVPDRTQFKSGEEFFGTCSHELVHSLGAKERLNRNMSGGFGSDSYAREELVAEFSAAIACLHYGFDKVVNKGSAPYLKGWLKALKEKPEYLKSILSDVKKAVNVLIEKLEAA